MTVLTNTPNQPVNQENASLEPKTKDSQAIETSSQTSNSPQEPQKIDQIAQKDQQIPTQETAKKQKSHLLKAAEAKKKAQKKSQDAFIIAFQEEFCRLATTLDKVGIDRRTYFEWLGDPEFKARINHCEEKKDDMIEGSLLSLVADKNPTIMAQMAKTKLKRRGYGEDPTIIVQKNDTFNIHPSTLIELAQEVEDERANGNTQKPDTTTSSQATN